jgi:hypothetical protein
MVGKKYCKTAWLQGSIWPVTEDQLLWFSGTIARLISCWKTPQSAGNSLSELQEIQNVLGGMPSDPSRSSHLWWSTRLSQNPRYGLIDICCPMAHTYWDRLNGELWSGELSRRVTISESYVRTTPKPRPLFPTTTPNFLTLPTFPWTNMRELCLT